MAKKRSKMGGRRPGAGRKRFFSKPTVGCPLHLPPEFWAVLDAMEGSRSRAFVAALEDPKKTKQLRDSLALARR